MGQFIKIPGVTPGTDRPKVDLVDPVVPTSGALLLVEPGHPVSPWASGVPTQGASIPNVVGALAATLLGSDTSKAGASVNEVDATNLIVPERTAKGGMHLAVAQSPSAFPSNTFWRLEMAAAVKQYLLSNPTHSYYLATTSRVSRLGLQTSAPFFVSTVAVGASAYLASITANQTSSGTQYGNYPSSSSGASTFLGARAQPAYENVAGTPHFADVAASGWQGTVPANLAAFYAHAFQVGRTSPVDPGGATTTKYPSLVFYRTYLEDLTVSGRTWAQVDALEYANYQQQFADGGRYAGDTWTTPTALVA